MKAPSSDKIVPGCVYCGREGRIGTNCRGCGAKLEPPEWTRGEYFEHGGYIVWPIRHYLNDLVEFCFYRGRYLEGKYGVSREQVMNKPGWSEGVDIFPEIFEEWQKHRAQTK